MREAISGDEARTVDRFLDDNAIETVELAVVDLMGAIRGKRIPAQVFRRSTEFALSSGMYCVDYGLDVLPPGGGYGWASGYPDVFLVPDPTTLRLVPWRPATALVFCDVVDRTGRPLPLDARQILRRAQEGVQRAGFDASVGLETEFYLLDPDSLRPRHSRVPLYSLHDDSYLWPVIRDVQAALHAVGVVVEASGAEYGAGQVEINLGHSSPLTAADDLLFFRYAVKQTAAAHGYLATFMAKPCAESSGSGLHVHQSLRSRETGRNAFWDGENDELSGRGRSYLAGLLRHAAETCHVAVPTPNGYKRSVGYSFAPTRVAWGFDHRSVAVRALVHGDGGTRLEHRVATADANPHLLVATQLLAGLAGLEEELEPPPPTTTDVYADDDAEPLPRGVAEAVTLFDGSKFARSALGDEVTEALCLLGRAEQAVADAEVSDWERRRYLESV
ncbi:glutamine synthetase family protein [Umezawaea endophytica]|uniref:Glutamine synthetase family protein n=1 Tax=Umezawaea endophytica TaxID=1654476 RepID=A0A9X2VKY4_9PSEU|nr:glutamine synthetase family protein [Umezawaea endophytica]MCS7477952.1 glutamine synthetase family protein [Umezawaea endophytica]